MTLVRRAPLLAALLAATAALSATAMLPAAARDSTVVRDGVTLHFVDAGDALDAATQDAIIETFFATYPRQAADFNAGAPDTVRITIDPGYDGVAFVDDAAMTINPGWLAEHPRDIDLVTHEAMHIVQAYGRGETPGWLVEGIADWARDAYGLDNAAGGWALPTGIAPDHRYDSGYRVTGAFLKWAEGRHPGLVRGLDASLRAQRYTPATWTALTGRDVDALWAQYVAARAAE
ncbi:basic secretory family protein [Luteimonas sp. BDR2-5]|uniref:basic secretory family protein n=1 Tax=Proluteimonas luteida TaxID=2878685 RepID=UPI001E44D45A|nr:basic secretory family protein [Luteimonas sp. BDR2-5]MCD9026958.1 basic secretory family protein [Luteimonas sp. BDR2-5]